MPPETVLGTEATDPNVAADPNAEANAAPAADPNAQPAPEQVEQPGADQQQEDGADGDKSEKDGDDKDKPEGAPEAYEAFTVPDGMELDGALVDQFTPVAKELNLSQDQAQRLVDLYAGAATQMREQWAAAWSDRQAEWVSTLKADPEIGGAKLDANVGIAASALKKFGTDGLREALNQTGAGNHPEVVRFFYRVGKAISEDRIEQSDRTTTGQRDPASILYPDSK